LNNSISKNNTAIIIPFFNEKDTILQVVELCSIYSNFILCIDDGSDDGSADLISNLENVIVLKNHRNEGKGSALRKGFEYLSEKNEIDFVITIDADLQHDPEYIPNFLEKIKECDLVIGNRMHDISKMPLLRILSNKITSKLLSLKLRTSILDSQSGYRCYRREILTEIICRDNGFEAESMHLIKAARKGYKIDFVNIPVKYGNDSSKMRNFEAIKGFIKVFFS